jgi:ketosteroid isomerase-like protein
LRRNRRIALPRQQDLLALVAEDIEWIIPGEDWPLAGRHRGHAELAAVLQKASDEVDMTYPEPPEFDEDATAPVAAWPNNSGSHPSSWESQRGGALVHARGCTWSQLIFQDSFKKER